MAEEKISFNIASYFKDEGFKKATAATSTLSKNTGKMISGISSLTNGIAGCDGAMGKWASTFGSILPMCTSVTGAFALLGIEAAALWKRFSELREVWKEEEKAAAGNVGTYEQMAGAHRRLLRSIEAVKKAQREKAAEFDLDRAKVEMAAIDEVAKSYKALATAENAVSGARGELAIARITNEFNDRLRKAANELDKGVIEAEKKLALAQLQGAQAIEKASAASEAQRESLVTLDQKIRAQQREVDALTVAQRDSTAAEEKLEKLKEERANQEKLVQAADLRLEAERVKAADAEAAARESVDALTRANVAAKEAREEAARKELEYAEEVSNVRQSAMANWNSLQGQIEGTTALAGTSLAGQQRTQKGMAADQRYHRGISGGGYTYSTDENGNVDNFIDWQRANRYAAREERDAQRGERRNASAERQAERLREKQARGDKLSDREKQQLQKYDDFKNQQKTKSDWQKAIDDLKGKQNKTLSDLDKTLEEIKDKFGLK